MLEHFKHQTSMVFMLKTLKSSNKIKFIGIFLTQPWQNWYFDLSLSGVRWMIFKNFDCHNLVCSFFPAFNHLAKSTTAKKFQNLKIEMKIECLVIIIIINLFDWIDADTFIFGKMFPLPTTHNLSVEWHLEISPSYRNQHHIIVLLLFLLLLF